MAKATQRLQRVRASIKPNSEAREVAAEARRLRAQLEDHPAAASEFRRLLGERCAAIVARVVGPHVGAKPIADQDMPTLALIALYEADDGRSRNAVLLELARAGGVDRRSL